MEEWKEYKIKDITSILGDGLHGTPKYDENGDVFFINGNNLEDGDIIIKKDTKRVSIDEAQKYIKPLNDRTILVSINGTIGNVAKYNGESCILGKSACYFNVNPDVDIDFVYYVVANSVFKNTITQLATGTTIKNVSLETMRNYSFRMPEIISQRKISSILRSIDSKIKLNKRINDNLEQQAQALFKSWFVDFEPFKGGKFVDSELGRIPEGWKVEPLINFCSEITRGNIPSYVEKSGFPILNQKVNKGFYLDKQYYKYNAETSQPQESKLAHKWDILLNSLGQGTLGRVHFYKDEKSNIIVDQFITILRANIFIKSAYLAFTLNRPEYQAIIESNITGSTGMWVLTINNIRKIKIVSPPISELSKISNLMENLYLKMNNNTKEQEELSILRDSLLPKLMSGELKINDLNN